MAEIAARSRIPAALLRELEWGDLRNWPTGPYGRTQLVRYARAAGLDDQLVVNTAWPLLEEWAGQITALAPVRVVDAVEVDAANPTHETPTTGLAMIPSTARASRARQWARTGALAALAIPALLAVGAAPALWGRAVAPASAPAVGRASTPVENTTPFSAASSPTAPSSATSPLPPSGARSTGRSPSAAVPSAAAPSASASEAPLSDAVPARGVRVRPSIPPRSPALAPRCSITPNRAARAR